MAPETHDMTHHRKATVPSYRLHKASGQAVVTLGGRDHYLGRHGTAESNARYERLVASYLLNGRKLPNSNADAPYRIATLSDDFLDWAEREYVRPDGSISREVSNVKLALRPLLRLFFDLDARRFGPQALLIYRDALIDEGLSRKVTNQRVNIVRRVFRWATRQEKLPPSVLHGLESVDGLKQGRSRARETRPVQCVPQHHIDRALAFMPPPIAAMVQLQMVTGARPGEIVVLRPCDVDMQSAVWLYRPTQHKNAWRGHDRVIAIGPRGQSIIRRFLRPGLQGTYLFSPKRSEEERLAGLRGDRQTPLWPSHIAAQRRKRANSKRRKLRDHYDTVTYRQAIQRACKRAGVPAWSPGRLRHNAATRIQRDEGLEAASAALGHRLLETTQIYANTRLQRAIEIAASMG